MNPAEMGLADVRRAAQDAARVGGWPTVLQLESRLREDTEMWGQFWAAVCAIAARTTGRSDARSLLDEAVAAGMFQPEFFEPDLSRAFAGDADWAQVVAAMAANTPPPPVTLTEWPTVTPKAPYTLFRLSADREAMLCHRIPEASASAWETAKALLTWVTNRWEHSSEHVEPDALLILDNVDAGARYACLEYSTVLSQALNARAIPSRRVELRTATGHAGLGSGHVVSEAWIDDLGRWVVLDGQNGIYWTDADGAPLGAVELQAHHRAGRPRPATVFLSRPLEENDLALWWTYFAQVLTNGVSWGTDGFVPYFEGAPAPGGQILADPAQAYPDFAELATTTAVHDGVAAVLPQPHHPFATGYRVIDDAGSIGLRLDEPWPLPLAPAGDHEVRIATLTPYGELAPATLRFTTT